MGTGFRYGGVCCRDSFSLVEKRQEGHCDGDSFSTQSSNKEETPLGCFSPSAETQAWEKKIHEQG